MRPRSRTIPALESLERRCLLTPMLHSLPGANHVIYLDFDGHTTTGTSWNSTYNNGQPIVSPGVGYDDATITRIWQRVSEDYAPFQIDVTTQEPTLAQLRYSSLDAPDTQWGVRVVFTGDQSWLTDNVGYLVGGVAWGGSFNWATDTPVFAFNAGEVAAAETGSHEAGHSLDLNHDGVTGSAYYYGHGSGATGWAPIMGAGFGRELSQWSKGEYPGATQKQDDLAIITTQNGFGYRADPPDMQELIVSASGIIERNTDVDGYWFTVMTESVVTINLSPAPIGPNLDILATLTRDGGEVIATSNPVDRLDASFAITLSPGVYVLKIDGTGKAAVPGDPGYSDYGSLGQYTITLSQTPTVAPAPEYLIGSRWTSNPGRIAPWQITAVRLAGAWSADALIITGRNGAIATAYTQQDGYTVWTISPVTADKLTLSGVVADRLDVLFGDVNGDGAVTIVDALLQRGYNGSADRWADIDGDGLVTMTDALLLRGVNGQRIPA